MATDDRVSGYAEAFLAVATAEGRVSEIEDELFTVSQALRENEELRASLGDAHVPPAIRQQIVEDLLGRRAAPATTALVSMVVGSGRSADLPDIVDAMVERSAASRNKGVARVRSAIELSADQQARLAAAISAATGTEVEVRVIIDPSVMGGVITELGDDIIDGSVRTRLNQMRESFR
jgi:F-type H+-transporting ATPase subunit delta